MNFKFTPAQAKHAQAVAMQLYKERRFFLPKGTTLEEPLPYLSRIVFEELYKLDRMFVDKYHSIRAKAATELLKLELDYGVNMPELKGGQNVVDCNRYTGGLDIVAIVPLAEDMLRLPELDSMKQELLEGLYPASRRGEVTPNKLQTAANEYYTYSSKVHEEGKVLQTHSDHTSLKFLVILQTRFEPKSKFGLAPQGDDFMQGKLTDVIRFPHMASYLVYQLAQKGILLSDCQFTISTSSRNGHICVELNEKTPRFWPRKPHGYDCKIAFATIL